MMLDNMPSTTITDRNITRIAYRPREAAKALGISPPTMYRWMALEGFPTLKVGGCTLIPVRELERWLSQQIGAPDGDNQGIRSQL